MKIVTSFNGQKCLSCDKPIYGEGIVADAVDFWGKLVTCYHVECYEDCVQAAIRRLQKELTKKEQKIAELETLLEDAEDRAFEAFWGENL